MPSQFHKFLKKKLDQKHNHSSSSSSSRRRRRPFNCRNDNTNPMSQAHYNDATSSNSFASSSPNNDYDSNMSNTGSNFSQSTNTCSTNKQQRRQWIGKRKGMLNSGKSNDNLDLKILDTEAKIQSQIRQLAIETLDEKRGSNRSNKGESKAKLMTSAGVLLFDGLGTSMFVCL